MIIRIIVILKKVLKKTLKKELYVQYFQNLIKIHKTLKLRRRGKRFRRVFISLAVGKELIFVI